LSAPEHIRRKRLAKINAWLRGTQTRSFHDQYLNLPIDTLAFEIVHCELELRKLARAKKNEL
jgi:hypothetical protein